RNVIDSAMRSTGIDHWRAYLRWYLTNAITPMLPALNRTTASVNGAAQAAPRAGLCVTMTMQYFGDPVARAFVARAFSAADRAAATAMVVRVRDAFREHLSSVDWLSTATRRRAIA